MAHAFVALGSNLGDRAGNLHRACQALSRQADIDLLNRSSIYHSQPQDIPPGAGDHGDYLNAVVAVQTSLTPLQLLALLQQVELDMDRRHKGEVRPRVIDLDLLLYDDRMFSNAMLILPHPRMHQRAFVLMPLVEIASEIEVPGRKLARALLADLPDELVAQTVVCEQGWP